MNEEEYQQHLVSAYTLCNLAERIPAREMVAMISRAETIAPILDPTLYIQKGRAAAEDKEILNALAVFNRRVAEIRKKAESRRT